MASVTCPKRPHPCQKTKLYLSLNSSLFKEATFLITVWLFQTGFYHVINNYDLLMNMQICAIGGGVVNLAICPHVINIIVVIYNA